jgi:protein gp37
MGKTSIEWAEQTWNPITGCAKVSAGCKNCYAETIAKRFWGDRKFTDVRFHPDRLEQPLRWRKPRMVFVNSMSDLFHEDVTNAQIAAVFGIMAATPQHTYQVLTKRPERMVEWFGWVNRECGRMSRAGFCSSAAHDILGPFGFGGQPWPLPNVWLGVSVENQETADERVPILLGCPAATRWVSYEPALGPVNLRTHAWVPWVPHSARPPHKPNPNTYLDWVVIGGESGHKARSFDLQWARDVLAQCEAAGVAAFVKQIGSNPIDCTITHAKGGDPAEWPADLRVREWPR